MTAANKEIYNSRTSFIFYFNNRFIELGDVIISATFFSLRIDDIASIGNEMVVAKFPNSVKY